MRYATIEENRITNIIEADASFAAALGAIPVEDGYGVGDLYQDGEFLRVNGLPDYDIELSKINAEYIPQLDSIVAMKAKASVYTRTINTSKLDSEYKATVELYNDKISALNRRFEPPQEETPVAMFAAFSFEPERTYTEQHCPICGGRLYSKDGYFYCEYRNDTEPCMYQSKQI